MNKLLPTSTAGSLPKPAWLAEPEKLWSPWKLEGEELASAKRDALLLSLKEQEVAGIDIIRPALVEAGVKAAGRIVTVTVEGDLHDIDLAVGEQIVVIDIGFAAEFRRESLQSDRIVAAGSDQPGRSCFLKRAGVRRTKIPCSDDTNAQHVQASFFAIA